MSIENNLESIAKSLAIIAKHYGENSFTVKSDGATEDIKPPKKPKAEKVIVPDLAPVLAPDLDDPHAMSAANLAPQVEAEEDSAAHRDAAGEEITVVAATADTPTNAVGLNAVMVDHYNRTGKDFQLISKVIAGFGFAGVAEIPVDLYATIIDAVAQIPDAEQ